MPHINKGDLLDIHGWQALALGTEYNGVIYSRDPDWPNDGELDYRTFTSFVDVVWTRTGAHGRVELRHVKKVAPDA